MAPATHTPETLGTYVRRARLAAGLTQRETAEACGMTRNAVTMTEYGTWHCRVPDTLLDGLARELSADRDELYALAGKLPPELRVMSAGEIRTVRNVLDSRRRALSDEERPNATLVIHIAPKPGEPFIYPGDFAEDDAAPHEENGSAPLPGAAPSHSRESVPIPDDPDDYPVT